jgi:hypothetical protein
MIGMEPRAVSNKRKNTEEEHRNCTSCAHLVLPTRLGASVHSGSVRDKQLRMLDYAEKACTCMLCGDDRVLLSAIVLQEFQLLREIGAVEWVPFLKDSYKDDKTWEVLRERWCL